LPVIESEQNTIAEANSVASAGNIEHQDALGKDILGRKIPELTGISRSDWLTWGRLSLGAYPSGV
jgi:hypothetical protein